MPLTIYLAATVDDHGSPQLYHIVGLFREDGTLLARAVSPCTWVTIETGLTSSEDVSLTAIPSALPPFTHIPS